MLSRFRNMADSTTTAATNKARATRVVAACIALAFLCWSALYFRKALILADQEWFHLWFTGRRITFGDDDSSVLATVIRSTVFAVILAVISIVILTCLWRKPSPVTDAEHQ